MTQSREGASEHADSGKIETFHVRCIEIHRPKDSNELVLSISVPSNFSTPQPEDESLTCYFLTDDQARHLLQELQPLVPAVQ